MLKGLQSGIRTSNKIGKLRQLKVEKKEKLRQIIKNLLDKLEKMLILITIILVVSLFVLLVLFYYMNGKDGAIALMSLLIIPYAPLKNCFKLATSRLILMLALLYIMAILMYLLRGWIDKDSVIRGLSSAAVIISILVEVITAIIEAIRKKPKRSND